jgi:hypothetical protein
MNGAGRDLVGGGALNPNCRRGVERHVLPVDRLTPLDASGFLDVSMADAWWAGPADRPRPITDLSGQAGSFMLLAADGAGKSTMLRGLRDRSMVLSRWIFACWTRLACIVSCKRPSRRAPRSILMPLTRPCSTSQLGSATWNGIPLPARCSSVPILCNDCAVITP